MEVQKEAWRWSHLQNFEWCCRQLPLPRGPEDDCDGQTLKFQRNVDEAAARVDHIDIVRAFFCSRTR